VVCPQTRARHRHFQHGRQLGTLTLTPATAYILQHFSWKAGFLFIGFSLLIPGILIAQLLMRRTVPEAYGLKPDGQSPAEEQRLAVGGPAPPPAPVSAKDIRRDSPFWILALCHGTAVMAALMAFVHQVPYAIDNGIAKVAAAISWEPWGLPGLLGQFFFGWISDRIGDPKYSAALGYAFMAAGTIMLLQTRTVEMLLAYSVVFGFGYGCLGPLLPIIAADRFGRQSIGAIFGMLVFFVVGIGAHWGLWLEAGLRRHRILSLRMVAQPGVAGRRDRRIVSLNAVVRMLDNRSGGM